MLENWPMLAMSKKGNHKQSLPERLADPELEAILEADRRSLARVIEAAEAQSNQSSESIQAILEAERLALERVLEAADRGLREALEADRLSIERLLTGT